MSSKQRRSGDQLHFTAGGTLAIGDVHVENDTIGILAENYVSGDAAIMALSGTFGPVPFRSADVVTPGMDLYWDSGNVEFTIIPATHLYGGKAASASPNGVATGDIRLVQSEA